MCAVKVADHHALALEIALRLSNVIAEVLVVAATWRATFVSARQLGSIKHSYGHTPLADLILRDGTDMIYYTSFAHSNIFQDPYTLCNAHLRRLQRFHLMHSSGSLLLSLNIAAVALWTKTVSRIRSMEVPYIDIVCESLSRTSRFSSIRTYCIIIYGQPGGLTIDAT